MGRFARWASPARKTALTISLLAATAYFLSVVYAHYPIDRWLFRLYAGYWLLTLAFNAACLSAGFALSRWIVPRGMALRERIAQSMALGVFAFYLGTFVAGLFHLYGAAYFIVWPVLMAASGAVAVYRTGRRATRALRGVRRFPRTRRSLLANGIVALGVLALAII